MIHILISMALFLLPYELITELQIEKQIVDNQAEVTLSWSLVKNADKIFVFRGNVLHGTYDGDATSVKFIEPDFGAIQYTVAWTWQGYVFDYKTGILSLGRITYNQPAWGDGFVVYVFEGPEPPEYFPEPALDTKELNPENPFSVTEIPLKELLDREKIEHDKEFYLAMATYANVNGQIMHSEITPVISATYKNITWDIPDLPYAPAETIIQW